MKQPQERNLIVPVIADFGGTGGLRRTGEYVRQHRGVVSAFYASNVEVYLNREKLAVFCRSLAMLPYNWQTWFIGSKGKQPLRETRRLLRPGHAGSCRPAEPNRGSRFAGSRVRSEANREPPNREPRIKA